MKGIRLTTVEMSGMLRVRQDRSSLVLTLLDDIQWRKQSWMIWVSPRGSLTAGKPVTL